jgi:hypothetical protein
MIDLLKLLGGLLIGLFRSRAAREADMAFLRQQVAVLQRSAPARIRLRTADRLIFVWFYRLFPSLLEAAVVYKPETLVRWHRSGFRLYWRWRSRRRGGRRCAALVPYARNARAQRPASRADRRLEVDRVGHAIEVRHRPQRTRYCEEIKLTFPPA